MSPEGMAALHARAFRESRAWSASEIAALLAAPGFAVASEAGFAIGRCVAEEAELITIAIDPSARRRGQGRALLAAFEARARELGTGMAFLEVAEDNAAAVGLYRAAGWTETGRRRGYYGRAAGPVDALTMSKSLD